MQASTAASNSAAPLVVPTLASAARLRSTGIRVQLRKWLLMPLALLFTAGCATRLPTPEEQVAVWLSEGPRTLSLYVDHELPQPSVRSHDRKVGERIGSGVGAGARVAAGAIGYGCLLGGPLGCIIGVVGVPFTFAIGATVGAAQVNSVDQSHPIEAAQGAPALFELTGKTVDVRALLAERVAAQARAARVHVLHVASSDAQGDASPKADGELKLHLQAVELFGGIGDDPSVALVLRVRADMRTPDTESLGWGAFAYEGSARLVSEWSVDDARLFREEIAVAVRKIATQIVHQLASPVPSQTATRVAASRSLESPPLSGYTCCNFHYEDDWISDANWLSMPMIPAGSPVRTLEFRNYRVVVELGGRRMGLGLDYGRGQKLAEWSRRMIVQEDPKPKIESWPAPVRDAVRAGKVALGMTKEQVIVSIGYPPAHQTASLESPKWTYLYTDSDAYEVVWDAAGRVKEVMADARILQAVLHRDDSNLVVSHTTIAVGTLAAQADLKPQVDAPQVGPFPAVGTTWVYGFTDVMYRAKLTIDVTVRVLRSDGNAVEELVTTNAPGGKPASRVVEARAPRFVEQPLGGSVILMEVAPYLLAAMEGRTTLGPVKLTGYPHGRSAMAPWMVTIREKGWERITVPAGSFQALRVEIDGRRKTKIHDLTEVGQFSMVAWYSPDVKRLLRLEHKTWSANSANRNQVGHDVFELFSYRPPS